MADGGNGEWTVDTLKAYFERILEEREKARDAQTEQIRTALAKAEEALEHRFELLNEFRAQSVAEQARFVEQAEFDALERRYEEKHGEVIVAIRLLQARVVPMLWVGSTLVIALVATFLSHIVAGTP